MAGTGSPGLPAADGQPSAEEVAAAVAEAAVCGEAANRARDLQNRPGNDLTPSALGEYAQALARDLDGVSVEVEGRDGIGQRNDRRGDDPMVGPIEAPVLIQPEVERMQ